MQMPVFFALFSVLRSIQDHVPTGSKLFHDLCQGEATAAACSSPDFASVKFLGMDLSIAASRASGGFLDTLPYYVLIALVIFTGWYQARQTMARQKSSGVSSPMTAQMQVIGKVMPVVFGLLSLNFAAGLVVYFVTSNFWRIGQQQLVLNKYYDHGRSDTATVEVSSTDPDADAAAEAKAKAAAAARRRKKKRKR
jgi:YidC/Oxa1 family membrane protein insertase